MVSVAISRAKHSPRGAPFQMSQFAAELRARE